MWECLCRTKKTSDLDDCLKPLHRVNPIQLLLSTSARRHRDRTTSPTRTAMQDVGLRPSDKTRHHILYTARGLFLCAHVTISKFITAVIITTAARCHLSLGRQYKLFLPLAFTTFL